jgi:diacylglycerol kinase (ATP)
MKSDNFSLKSRLKSFRFAFNGISSLLKNEHNARIHILAVAVALATGIVLKINFQEWCFIIIAIGLVFIAELFNTSLETIADAVDPEWNEKIRKAKDYAAAAVLISTIAAVIIAGLIFIPAILKLI